MDVEDDEPEDGELISRAPTEEDIVGICRLLNAEGAKYLIIGGFAIIYSGYGRTTGDVDLLIDTSPENEARVYRCLESLPDKAVLQLDPGDVAKYTVVRVADEIVVDLMKSASGIDYAEAAKDIVIREVQGVPVPFASPKLLWRMKKNTHRQKDAVDLLFLRQQYPEVIEE
ncbi:MAG: hypothetical protein KDK97_15820 [Verrucomicrobiales bacterium]|nr:hypothetical protein [Verrucomicrobiales bacterium]MCP5559377.1 hypothetical protein [Verrucomicrobiaceae bacterium]